MSKPLPPIVPGDDYPLTFTFKVKATGLLEDQAGGTILVVVKASADPAAPILTQLTVPAAVPTTLGRYDAVLPSSQTKAYPQNSQVFIQARRTLGGLKRTPLLTRIRTLDAVIDDA